MSFKRIAVSLLVALPLARRAAAPTTASMRRPSIDPMFRRYVSLGNSITAGFQSAGINDSTQQRSYAVLLGAGDGHRRSTTPSAQRAGAVRRRSTNNVTAGPGGRRHRRPPAISGSPSAGPINNVAVPGATVAGTAEQFRRAGLRRPMR